MQQNSKLLKALQDPGSVFDSPEAVLSTCALTQNQKVKILRRWAYDARGIAVAEGEGLSADRPSLLHRSLLALLDLGVDLNLDHGSPTEQAGA